MVEGGAPNKQLARGKRVVLNSLNKSIAYSESCIDTIQVLTSFQSTQNKWTITQFWFTLVHNQDTIKTKK